METNTPHQPGSNPSSLRDIAFDWTRERRDSDHGRAGLAIDVWRGLVVGRWALIDHFQRDGRQYLVARRCHSGRLQGQRLTQRECEVAADAIRGHSNKMIGYRLGIAETTVATHLRRALIKLGIRSRTDLIRLLPIQAFQSDDEPEQAGPETPEQPGPETPEQLGPETPGQALPWPQVATASGAGGPCEPETPKPETPPPAMPQDAATSVAGSHCDAAAP